MSEGPETRPQTEHSYGHRRPEAEARAHTGPADTRPGFSVTPGIDSSSQKALRGPARLRFQPRPLPLDSGCSTVPSSRRPRGPRALSLRPEGMSPRRPHGCPAPVIDTLVLEEAPPTIPSEQTPESRSQPTVPSQSSSSPRPPAVILFPPPCTPPGAGPVSVPSTQSILSLDKYRPMGLGDLGLNPRSGMFPREVRLLGASWTAGLEAASEPLPQPGRGRESPVCELPAGRGGLRGSHREPGRSPGGV